LKFGHKQAANIIKEKVLMRSGQDVLQKLRKNKLGKKMNSAYLVFIIDFVPNN
jgi:hypothetical protein